MKTFYTAAHVLGNSIVYRGVRDGKRIRQRVDYSPTLFLGSDSSAKYRTLYGQPVKPVEFASIKEARDFLKSYEDVQGFEVFGNSSYQYTFLAENFPGELPWDTALIDIAIIDIEVASENGFALPDNPTEEITAISLRRGDKCTTWSCVPYENPDPENVTYVRCKDEIDLIKRFLVNWELDYPDIITGWNIKFYDFPYIINRVKKLFGDKEANRMSPWSRLTTRTVVLMGKEQTTYEMMGVAQLDYIELFRKFAKDGQSQESYKLDDIAEEVIGEKKIAYEGTLHTLYKENPQKFIDYNIHDTTLVKRIDDKVKCMDVALTLAYHAKVNYEDVLAQTRMWDSIIFNHLKPKKIVVPQKSHNVKTHAFEGAFVKNPEVGKYRWCMSFDATSLYPSLIMWQNMSPESLVEPQSYTDEIREFMSQGITVDKLLNNEIDTTILKKYNYTLTPNGVLFRMGKQAMMAEVVEDIFLKRKHYKKMMLQTEQILANTHNAGERKALEAAISKYDNMQSSMKINANSLFGAAGNEYFRFYDIRIAEGITMAGQLCIRYAEKAINQYLNKVLKTKDFDYVIGIDTDSLFINFGDIIDKMYTRDEQKNNPKKIVNFLDKLGKEVIKKELDKAFFDLSDRLNANQDKIDMKREVIADVGIWTGKKHYVLSMWDKEGVRYEKPKLKYVGLETNKSSTPKACRVALKEAIRLVTEDNHGAMVTYIEDFRTKFKAMPLEKVAFPRGVRGLEDYADKSAVFKKGAPMHVKAALFYNSGLEKYNLTRDYQKIRSGEKLRYIFLKEPNPAMTPVIGFQSKLPDQFGLTKYIDWDRQFQSAFLDPLQGVLDVVGWRAEEEYNLFT